MHHHYPRLPSGGPAASFAAFFHEKTTPMSTPTKTTEATTKSATPERGVTMSGAEILVECLIREGVDTIFAYPGGASMHMHQALTKREDVLRT